MDRDRVARIIETFANTRFKPQDYRLVRVATQWGSICAAYRYAFSDDDEQTLYEHRSTLMVSVDFEQAGCPVSRARDEGQ